MLARAVKISIKEERVPISFQYIIMLILTHLREVFLQMVNILDVVVSTPRQGGKGVPESAFLFSIVPTIAT